MTSYPIFRYRRRNRSTGEISRASSSFINRADFMAAMVSWSEQSGYEYTAIYPIVPLGEGDEYMKITNHGDNPCRKIPLIRFTGAYGSPSFSWALPLRFSAPPTPLTS